VKEALNQATILLRSDLDQSMKSFAGSTSWRNDSFFPPSGGGIFGAGSLNYSPGWFQRLQEVRPVSFWYRISLMFPLNLKQLTDNLYVSTALKTDAAAKFIEASVCVEVLCNAMTALTAPQQYDIGLTAVQRIKDGQSLHRKHPIVNAWISVWSGFAVIVNRATALHRDWGGSATHFDSLFSAGTHTNCNLDVPDIGATFSYLPGTGVAIVGKVLRHGVKVWEGGERICQARFMKDAVHDRLGLPKPTWVNYDDYIGLTSI